MKGEIELIIDDFRDLGFQYLAYLGGEDYIKCECCNRPVKVKSKFKPPKYCDKCSKEKELEKYIKYNKKR